MAGGLNGNNSETIASSRVSLWRLVQHVNRSPLDFPDVQQAYTSGARFQKFRRPVVCSSDVLSEAPDFDLRGTTLTQNASASTNSPRRRKRMRTGDDEVITTSASEEASLSNQRHYHQLKITSAETTDAALTVCTPAQFIENISEDKVDLFDYPVALTISPPISSASSFEQQLRLAFVVRALKTRTFPYGAWTTTEDHIPLVRAVRTGTGPVVATISQISIGVDDLTPDAFKFDAITSFLNRTTPCNTGFYLIPSGFVLELSMIGDGRDSLIGIISGDAILQWPDKEQEGQFRGFSVDSDNLLVASTTSQSGFRIAASPTADDPVLMYVLGMTFFPRMRAIARRVVAATHEDEDGQGNVDPCALLNRFNTTIGAEFRRAIQEGISFMQSLGTELLPGQEIAQSVATLEGCQNAADAAVKRQRELEGQLATRSLDASTGDHESIDGSNNPTSESVVSEAVQNAS